MARPRATFGRRERAAVSALVVGVFGLLLALPTYCFSAVAAPVGIGLGVWGLRANGGWVWAARSALALNALLILLFVYVIVLTALGVHGDAAAAPN